MTTYPISVKGVLIHRDRVLLLLNERGEWDLPGGRPEAGEDHRAAVAREVREEAGLDVAVEAGRRGKVMGRRAGERSKELAHAAAEKVESADITGRTIEKLHDVAG